MAPGIITPPGGLDATIQKQKAVMIRVAGVKHPVAIGIAEASANELATRKSGKAVKARITNLHHIQRVPVIRSKYREECPNSSYLGWLNGPYLRCL